VRKPSPAFLQVDYHHQSGEVNAEEWPPEDRNRIRLLKASWIVLSRTAASTNGKAADVGFRKLVLAFRLMVKGTQKAIKFARLPSASAQAGPVLPRQNYMALTAMQEYDPACTDLSVLEGLELQLERWMLIRPLHRRTGRPKKLRSPFDQILHSTVLGQGGRVVDLSEDEMLLELLGAETQTDTIYVNQLTVKRVLGCMDTWVVTGVESSFPVLTASGIKTVSQRDVNDDDDENEPGDEECGDPSESDGDYLRPAPHGFEGQRAAVPEAERGARSPNKLYVS